MVIAFEGFTKQHKVIAAPHAWLGIAAILAVTSIRFVPAVMAAAFGHVDFAADHGLDVALACFAEEIRGGKEISVVGDGHGGQFLWGSLIGKRRCLLTPHRADRILYNGEIQRTA